MKRLCTVFFFFFLFSFSLYAQQVWYFGNGAGLDFSSGIATPVHNGKLFTLEGCAAVYDKKGQIIFYTDGITVWDKFHKEINNGNGLNGSRSSTQSAFIVAQPSRLPLPSPSDSYQAGEVKNGRYFLFTTDEKAGNKGFCYSVIDIASGTGTVTKKNIQLLSVSTEKIIAGLHANGKDSWVITHQWNSNNFYAFPVTSQGVGSPVISSIGYIHTETGSGENREAIGSLRISPDGKKIASVVCYRSENNLELFDFDNLTGKVSNPATVTLNGSPYGLCFSPNNKRLYISFLKGKWGIAQYDLNTGAVAEITPNEADNSYGALQLGADGKMYVARTGKFIDAIEFPDKTALLCKYKKAAIDLSPASSNYGLPDFYMPSASLSADCSKIIEKPFSNKDKLLMTEISVCENEYILDAKNLGASFTWSTSETTQKIRIDTSGVYRVSLSKHGCDIKDSIRVRFRKEQAIFRFLPAFNPEDEFLNSEFYYEIDEVKEFELKVLDKKKKVVLFETKNTNNKWNGKNKKGKIVPAGEYLWSVKYKPNCPRETKPVVQEGKVTVKRKK